MIQLESIKIEEFRGIRNLELNLSGKNFAICGRNGTGKSGIVDAIEFGLTGTISRLSGEGTSDLSVKDHAPHVDSKSSPENSRVTLELSIPSSGKKFTIVRSPKSPTKPVVDPSSEHILKVLGSINSHPELVLTRREIIRYVLATEGKRAEEVQAVLKLDSLDHIRKTLQTIANASEKELKNATTTSELNADNLARALNIPSIAQAEFLRAVNEQRQLLSLSAIVTLTQTTSVKEGISTAGVTSKSKVSKKESTDNLLKLRSILTRLEDHDSDVVFIDALSLCRSLCENESLLRTLSREGFILSGQDLIDEERCPFCDKEWEMEALKVHIAQKLAELSEVRRKRDEAEAALNPIIVLLSSFIEIISVSINDLKKIGSFSFEHLVIVKEKYILMKQKLENLLPIYESIKLLQEPVLFSTEALQELNELGEYISKLPDPSKEDAAKEILIISQEKLEVYREARRKQAEAQKNAELTRTIADSYTRTFDSELTTLYSSVEKDFADMYRALNSPDEDKFDAKLTPSIGKLGFYVDFYGRGYFPPGAYHSEGHQDAMGLCLYLALMTYVMKDNFKFAVLDDVLMSIDAGHRKAICSLLKTKYPNTQFVLTTHDPVWLNHMRSEGLITSKSAMQFHSWHVDSGPAFWDNSDVWNQIDTELSQDRVEVAAGLLRRYLEYVSAECCERLNARVEFKQDARVVLGMLLPPAYERLNGIYKKGIKAAHSWGHKDVFGDLTGRKNNLVEVWNRSLADQWQTNAAIHYNQWASLLKQDFAPVVTSFKELMDEFKCRMCDSYLKILRDGHSDKAVQCECGKSGFNLTSKQ